jgi:hypothetical protein
MSNPIIIAAVWFGVIGLAFLIGKFVSHVVAAFREADADIDRELAALTAAREARSRANHPAGKALSPRHRDRPGYDWENGSL